MAPKLTRKILDILETLSWMGNNLVYPGQIQNTLNALDQIAELVEYIGYFGKISEHLLQMMNFIQALGKIVNPFFIP